MHKNYRCHHCKQPLMDDGHGDVIHEETQTYQCNPKEKNGTVATI